MVDAIVEKFNEIVYKACERYGKEEGLETNKVQVLFFLDDEGEVAYKILKEYRPWKQVTFLEILNVKIDFKLYSVMVPPFIQNTLIAYSEKLETNAQDLFVMCVVKGENKVGLFLYKDKKPIEEINLEEL